MSAKLFWQIVLLMVIGLVLAHLSKCVVMNGHSMMGKKACPMTAGQMPEAVK